MTLQPKTRRRLIVAGILAVGLVTPGFALFGIGDVVFDPTNYAQLVSQATTAINQYHAFVSNVQHFTLKQVWQTEQTQLEHVPFKSVFGENAGFDAALTTNSPSTAQMAWQNSTLQVNSGATNYLASQPTGGAGRSQLASIEATDATSSACINAVGAYKAAVATNAASESSLRTSQLDDDDSTNSEVQQLNLLNASQAQHLVELKQQGMLHACLAQQMAISNMQQRNAAANDLNTWGVVQQQRSVNDASPAGSSGTWTTYLP